MKRSQLLGGTFLAVVVFGAVMSASSSAAVTFLLAEWLVDGTAITTTLSVTSSTTAAGGPLALEANTLLGKVTVLCSGAFDGNIGVSGADELTELLNTAGELISLTGLTGLALECTSDTTGLCTNPVSAWAVNLPWTTLLELMEEGTESFLVDLILPKAPNTSTGYEMSCANGLSDTCTTSAAVAKITNEAGGVDELFEDAFTGLAELKLSNCVTAGAETGILSGLTLLSLVEAGHTLTASSVG